MRMQLWQHLWRLTAQKHRALGRTSDRRNRSPLRWWRWWTTYRWWAHDTCQRHDHSILWAIVRTIINLPQAMNTAQLPSTYLCSLSCVCLPTRLCSSTPTLLEYGQRLDTSRGRDGCWQFNNDIVPSSLLQAMPPSFLPPSAAVLLKCWRYAKWCSARCHSSSLMIHHMDFAQGGL